MNNKYAGIAIISIGFLLLATIAYFVFFYDFSPEAPVTVPSENQTQETKRLAPSVSPPASRATTSAVVSGAAPAVEYQNSDLKRLASAFAERFGSYSNQSALSNFTALKVFMSKRMQDWADNYITQEISRNNGSIYYSLVTKSVVADIKKVDDAAGRAEVLVKTQRREFIGSENNSSFFQQDILIAFIKDRKAWKVDSAFWQERK